MRTAITTSTLIACGLSMTAAGCHRSESSSPDPGTTTVKAASTLKEAPEHVRVDLEGRDGSYLKGYVDLRRVDEGVEVELSLAQAIAGRHGVHLHDRADCSAQDAHGVGPVWNPKGADAAPKRLGDLGDVEVGSLGEGNATFTVKDADLEPDSDLSLLGRALVVHARPDGEQELNVKDTRRVGCAELRATEETVLSQR